jgi:hypothetical protein
MNGHKSTYRQQHQEHEKEVVGRVSQKLHRHNNTDYITDKKYGVRTGAQTRQRNGSPLQALIRTTESDK